MEVFNLILILGISSGVLYATLEPSWQKALMSSDLKKANKVKY